MADDNKITTSVTENNVIETKETVKPVSQSSSGSNQASSTNNNQKSAQDQPNQNNQQVSNQPENPAENPDQAAPASTPADPNATPKSNTDQAPAADETDTSKLPADNKEKNPEEEKKEGENKEAENAETTKPEEKPGEAADKTKQEDVGTPNPNSGAPGPDAPGGVNNQPPKTPTDNKTGTTGLGGDNKDGSNPAADAEKKKLKDKLAKETEKKVAEEAEKKAIAGAAGGGFWWIVLGILIIILIFVLLTFGGTAINAINGGFGKSSPLPSGKNYSTVKKLVKMAGTKLKTKEGTVDKYKQLDLNAEDQKAIEDGKVDKRLLDMLAYLTNLHSHLKISHIVSGYKKTDTKESGADRSAQIAANVSAHVDGLAADISEIDYVYRVNEPKVLCQQAASAACGPLAFACKQAVKESELGDLVYYASDEVKAPADLIPAGIKAKTASGSGQDAVSFAADTATIAANQNVTDVLNKIKQSQNKLKQMLDKFNSTKDALVAKRNDLTGQLANSQGEARQKIQSQIDLLNQNISSVNSITAKIDGYQNQINGFSNITGSLQGSLNGISQTINKYSNLNNLNVPIDTGSSLVDGKIQGLISNAKNKITDVTSLGNVAGTVNGQIGDLSNKINSANTSITDFSNTLDPVLNEVNNATSQLENGINSTASGALNQTNLPMTQADLDIINNISNTVNTIGNNPILNTALSDNPFGQLENSAKGLANSIQGQVNSAISSGINTVTNTVNAPVNEINGLANSKIDAVNQQLNSMVDGLNGIKNNFVAQAAGDINQVTAESKVVKQLNETISKIQSILGTITTLRNNLGNFVSKVTSLQNSLATIGNVANTVADVNKITSQVGIDTSSARDVATEIDKINQAIDNSLNKVNGILTVLDQETANLNSLLAQLQSYSNQPAAEVSKYLDSLTPSLNRLESIGHIDILSALNIDLSSLGSLQGVIDGYIEKLKTEAFDKIQNELDGKLKEAIGNKLGDVIGSQIPGLGSLGLGGSVDNQELLRIPCLGTKYLVTPKDTKLGGNKAVVVPLKVEWQELTGIKSVNSIDAPVFATVLMPQTQKKIHELITQILKYPYDMKDKYYYKANQIITYSEDRDVKPFWDKLKDLYGLPRGKNIGLFAMPEAIGQVHIAY